MTAESQGVLKNVKKKKYIEDHLDSSDLSPYFMH